MTPDIRSLFAQAVGHHQAGRLDEAIACYRQVVTLKPDLAAAHHHLANALFGQGDLSGAEAGYRRALALQPTLANAHNNLGILLFGQDKVEDAEACYRQALALEPDYAEALGNLGTVLWDQGRPAEAEASLRRALALAPSSTRPLETLGALLKDQGRLGEALAAILHALSIAETSNAKRIFVDIAKHFAWAGDNRGARAALARALTEPWVRPAQLAATGASLIKQNEKIGAAVARAASAWPRQLPATELFGADGPGPFADDRLLLALLTSVQNTDVALERFLTMARRALLDAADGDADDADLEFYAALACQCFINEYVFFHDEEEIRNARSHRDALTAALDEAIPISPLRLLAAAAYFPLHSLPDATRLLERTWPKPVTAVLTQQVREPEQEAQLRAAIPRLTPIQDTTSRLVRDQYEENPYPRWVRMPRIGKADSIARYLRRKFPLAAFQQRSDKERVEFLSAGCGTGQMALEIGQGVAARVLAIDLSLASLGYAKRKAVELDLAGIEFAQADLLEFAATGRRFDVVECSGVLHHLADPFAGWRALLPLLNPGGFMLVALYSEAARRGVVDARRFIAQKGYGASADDIRRCRQDLLRLDPNGGLGTGFGDFFGVSSCRDLLFHVQEQRMTLPDIAVFLEANDLAFLGFETDNGTLQTYRQRFPTDPAAANLQNWDAFEKGRPDTFAGMYVFWIQKNG